MYFKRTKDINVFINQEGCIFFLVWISMNLIFLSPNCLWNLPLSLSLKVFPHLFLLFLVDKLRPSQFVYSPIDHHLSACKRVLWYLIVGVKGTIILMFFSSNQKLNWYSRTLAMLIGRIFYMIDASQVVTALFLGSFWYIVVQSFLCFGIKVIWLLMLKNAYG